MFTVKCFTLYLGQFSKYKPPGGLYLEGRFNGGFLRYRFGWAYLFQRPFLRGLFLEGLIFGGAYVRREICV